MLNRLVLLSMGLLTGRTESKEALSKAVDATLGRAKLGTLYLARSMLSILACFEARR
jgi:hypothetical protein